MGIFTELQSYVDEMRSEAEVVAKYEGDAAAERIRRHADRLEARIEQIRTRELTPREAANEVSWKPETVAKRIGTQLPAGSSSERGSPTVRRCDLYAVVNRGEELSVVEGPDAAERHLQAVE